MVKAWRSAKLAVCRRIGCGPVGRDRLAQQITPLSVPAQFS